MNNLRTLKRHQFDIFTVSPEFSNQEFTRPPSEPPLCTVLWFPLSKEQSLANKNLVNIKFRELVDTFLPTAVSCFTDGSLSNETRGTSCAVYSPDLNTSSAWLLTNGTSIFSAELIGIYQALKIACEKARPLEEIYVFSDSRSAIQSVTSTGQKTSHYILRTHNLLRQLKESGATVTLVWIPSHCGIAGNERADKLAFEMCLPANTTTSYIQNVLSTDEQLHLYRKLWLDEWLTQLKTSQKGNGSNQTAHKTSTLALLDG